MSTPRVADFTSTCRVPRRAARGRPWPPPPACEVHINHTRARPTRGPRGRKTAVGAQLGWGHGDTHTRARARSNTARAQGSHSRQRVRPRTNGVHRALARRRTQPPHEQSLATAGIHTAQRHHSARTRARRTQHGGITLLQQRHRTGGAGRTGRGRTSTQGRAASSNEVEDMTGAAVRFRLVP